jgi:hypothetical protein
MLSGRLKYIIYKKNFRIYQPRARVHQPIPARILQPTSTRPDSTKTGHSRLISQSSSARRGSGFNSQDLSKEPISQGSLARVYQPRSIS